MTKECFEDVWYDTDTEKSGFISWHKIKPFMAKLLERQVEIDKEEKALADENKKRFAEYQKRKEARAERKRLEEERRLAEEEEEQDEA